MDYSYIAVEGPIGVGKTTLARRIAESTDARILYDPESENPFLEDFYNKPGSYALHTQLDFLVRRSALLDEELQTVGSEPLVTDFLIAKDRLFAELTLNEDELWLYERIHEKLVSALPAPSLVIYLQAPPETLMARIETRGIGFEQRMASGYLQRLSDAYATFFHEYSETPLLIVNAEEINFADNNRDYENLLEQIGEVGAGRHYLNPLPA
ncbi:MAG: deoxynucleoside kinase [Gammaproteobacteria bacterium]|nr:deoxynucleoside kinase [Gammaproteobacteria bacterium]